jgi:hypothetical protein
MLTKTSYQHVPPHSTLTNLHKRTICLEALLYRQQYRLHSGSSYLKLRVTRMQQRCIHPSSSSAVHFKFEPWPPVTTMLYT